MLNISPARYYYLQEILDLNLIPGVSGYTGLYNLVTEKMLVEKVVKDKNRNPIFRKDGKPKTRKVWRRELAKKTTVRSLKAEHDGNPWREIKGKIKVQGAEIILFLKENNMIKVK